MALTISSHFTHAPRGKCFQNYCLNSLTPKTTPELPNIPQSYCLNSCTPELQNSQIFPKAIVCTPVLLSPELPNIPPFDAHSGSSDADDATVMWLRQLPLTAPRASRSSSMAMRLSQ